MKKECKAREREVVPALSRVRPLSFLSQLLSSTSQPLPTGLVRFYQQTLTYTAFASLNSLIFAYMCVCVGLLSLFPLPAKKTFITKNQPRSFFWVDWKRSKRNVSQKRKKKRSATLPRHQRLHFRMRATFSHLLYVCLKCECVCMCAWNFLLAPASAYHVQAGFILCLCASVASFTFFPLHFRVGHRNTPFALLLLNALHNVSKR